MMIADGLYWLWGQLSYIFAVIIGAALVAVRMPRRDGFALRVICSCIVLTVIKMVTDVIFIQGQNYNAVVFVNLCLSLMLYVLTSVAVIVCFDCDIFAGLFCGTIGYSLQHIAHRLYMVYRYTVTSSLRWVNAIILTAITVTVYYVANKLLLEKNRYRNIVVDDRMQITISTLFIMAVIFLGQFILNAADNYVIRLQILVMSIATCFLGILLELSNMSSKNIELERDIAARLRAEEKEKLRYDKSVIDMLDIKAHDLKHQLVTASSLADPEAVKETEEAVATYESIVYTGSDALDAVMARKSRIAQEKGIKLTCLANGQKLSFMSDIDIYSLFGNILDNAIEATEKLPDPEKRVISVTVEGKGFFVSVSATNYFEGFLDMSEGLPHTTKQDRMYHGFGLQSIKLLCEKYHGDLSISTKEDMFVLDILFPV